MIPSTEVGPNLAITVGPNGVVIPICHSLERIGRTLTTLLSLGKGRTVSSTLSDDGHRSAHSWGRPLLSARYRSGGAP